MAIRTVAGINGNLIEVDDTQARTFSKFKLFQQARSLGYWKQIKAWLEANDLWDAFLIAQVVTEDNAQFKQGLDAIASELGLTDEKVEEILSICVADDALGGL